MAENTIDAIVKQFVDTKDDNAFKTMMEALEKSMVFIPAMPPKKLSPKDMAAVRAGKTLPVDPNNQPEVCLLAQANGERIFPIFTSKEQIPKERMTQVIMNAPFQAVVGMVKRNSDKVSKIVVNPFTMGVVLNEKIIDVADSRFKAAAEGLKAKATAAAKAASANNAFATSNNVAQVSEEDFHKIAHTRVARDVLAKQFIDDAKDAVAQLRLKKEQMIIEAYKSVYPAGFECPYSEDDVAVMMLQLEENLLLIRIDMPEENMIAGGAERIYITCTDDMAIRYFIVEKSTKEVPGEIGEVTSDGEYVSVMPKPDNGVEIETIVSLIRPS